MCNKERKRCLFIVSKIDIISSNRRTPNPLIINVEQLIKSFLV